MIKSLCKREKGRNAMNQKEYIKGVKEGIITLDRLDGELGKVTSMCAAFESAYSEGYSAPETFFDGFTLFYEILFNLRAEHAAFSRYMADTYLHEEPTEA